MCVRVELLLDHGFDDIAAVVAVDDGDDVGTWLVNDGGGVLHRELEGDVAVEGGEGAGIGAGEGEVVFVEGERAKLLPVQEPSAFLTRLCTPAEMWPSRLNWWLF